MGIFGKRKNSNYVDGLVMYIPPDVVAKVPILTSEDFERFQNSPNFKQGGRIFEVSREYSYELRTVADLVEKQVATNNVADPRVMGRSARPGPAQSFGGQTPPPPKPDPMAGMDDMEMGDADLEFAN